MISEMFSNLIVSVISHDIFFNLGVMGFFSLFLFKHMIMLNKGSHVKHSMALSKTTAALQEGFFSPAVFRKMVTKMPLPFA